MRWPRIWAASRSSQLFARLGAQAVTATLAVELIAAIILLIGTAGHPGMVQLIVVVLVFGVLSGLGSGGTEPVLRAVTLGFAPPGSYGVAASFLQLTQRLAGTFFVALCSGLLLAGGTRALSVSVLVGGAATALALLLSLHRSFRSPVLAPSR